MKLLLPLLLIQTQVVLGITPWPVDPHSSTILPCEEGDLETCLWKVTFLSSPETPVTMSMLDVSNGVYPNYGYANSSDGECDLEIEMVHPDMSGRFVCVDETTEDDGTVKEKILEEYDVVAHETSDLFFSFNDQEYENGERIRPNLEKKETYEFVCGATSTIEPNMNWILNSKQITTGIVLELSDPTKNIYTSTLTLEVTENGEYDLICAVSNNFVTGGEVLTVSLFVGEKDFEGRAYTSTILPCDMPSEDCVWEIETVDGEIDSFDMTDIIDGLYPKYGHSIASKGDCDLLIKETIHTDAGLYFCNNENMTLESYNLLVNDMSDPILYFDGEMYDNNHKLEEALSINKEYEFQCEIPRASPEPSIRWLQNGDIDVTEYSEIKAEQNELGVIKYTNTLLFNVTEKGEQSLMCAVEHKLLESRVAVSLSFNGSATFGGSVFSLVFVLFLGVLPTYIRY